MKLTELATPKKSRQVTRVFESYFGTKMPVNKLTVREAQAMLKRVRGVIAEHQRSPSRHTSERNPAYLKLVMMEQALSSRISEDMVPPAGAAPAGAAVKPGAPAAPATPDPAAALLGRVRSQNGLLSFRSSIQLDLIKKNLTGLAF